MLCLKAYLMQAELRVLLWCYFMTYLLPGERYGLWMSVTVYLTLLSTGMNPSVKISMGSDFLPLLLVSSKFVGRMVKVSFSFSAFLGLTSSSMRIPIVPFSSS